ncbi:MAG: response regulator [Lachnospiraceae bacterium]|nr:response regulator [Lachnospiraceae bacterium]
MGKETLILVVDDAEINLKIAEKIISREYSVECVSSGEDCLAYLMDHNPDLILLDLHMPELDGFEVMEKLNASANWKDIPVIFLTADSDHDSEIQGFELGAMDFITKPFVAEVMMKRVARVLELSTLQKNLVSEVKKQTAVAEERREKVEQMSIRMIQAFATTLDAKDAYTNGHASRVAQYAAALAKKLGWDAERIESLKSAAILHDIGKISVPDRVLNKTGRLSDEEFGMIKAHTHVGSDILEKTGLFDFAQDVARHHHERYDGTGYPDRLSGENISCEARIVGIADAFDAMSSKRVYRPALPLPSIKDELIKGKGTQFDPTFADIFIEMFEHGELDSIMQAYRGAGDETSLEPSEEEISSGGLLHRSEGVRRIEKAMAESKGCLIIFDLDNLKAVNESEGHSAGDRALELISRILEDYGKGIACRFGGDEFVLFIPYISKEEGERCADEIMNDFATRKIGLSEFSKLSLSAGICMSDTIDRFSDVYNNADKALYYVKRSGKAGKALYETAENFSRKHSNIELLLIIQKIKRLKSGQSASYGYQGKEMERLLTRLISEQSRSLGEYAFVMITLENAPGETHYIEEIESAMESMEYAIKEVTKENSECIRYSNVQYLLVFKDESKSKAEGDTEKIVAEFYKHSVDTGLQASYAIEMMP